MEDQDLVSHLRPCQCPRTMPHLQPCCSGGPVLPPGAIETSRHWLMPRAMSGSMGPADSGVWGGVHAPVLLRALQMQGSSQLPGTMLMHRSYTAARAVLI